MSSPDLRFQYTFWGGILISVFRYQVLRQISASLSFCTQAYSSEKQMFNFSFSILPSKKICIVRFFVVYISIYKCKDGVTKNSNVKKTSSWHWQGLRITSRPFVFTVPSSVIQQISSSEKNVEFRERREHYLWKYAEVKQNHFGQ